MTEHARMIKVGSRKSQLALIQTNTVVDLLKKCHPDVEYDIITMTTTGDNILDTALSKIGEKSLFTKELDVALLEHRVDFVVHSLKDLPTELPPGLVVGAVCKRDDPRDALVLRIDQTATSLSALPQGSVIGTSSLRRAAQLKRRFPHLTIADIRGNLNTRLRKLDESGDYCGIVLAVAGLERMGWQDRMTQVLEPDVCMYAVSQGAVAVECRVDDIETLQFLSVLNDYATVLQCTAERAFLKQLEGGCSVPVAVQTKLTDDQLNLQGGVFSICGTEAVMGSLHASVASGQHVDNSRISDQSAIRHYAAVVAPNVSQHALQAAEQLGIDLAKELMRSGATEILAVAKRQTADEIHRQKAAKAAAGHEVTMPDNGVVR